MGIESLLQQNTQNTDSNGISDSGRFDFMNKGMYPMSQMNRSYYSSPTQAPLAAQEVSEDYDPATNPLTGEPVSHFAQGGIATLHFAEGDPVEEPPAWNPESGQVKLQQLADPKDPFGEMKSIDYTIPKDQIKTFIPNIDQETGQPNGSGAYVLKDGSTLGVDNKGIVSAATPGRNDYTLNKEGYYQPTGANLTWDGGANMLTKKIGGVDVQVPGIYHKGGYQDAKGNLKVNEDGVPVPLAPNYLDSGYGKSGLADAAPYIALAAMTAATMGAAAPAAGGFAGMVPASETLLGSMGAGALGSTAGISTADLGTTAYIAPEASAFPGVSTADLGTTSYLAPSSSVPSGTSAFPGVSTADLGTTSYIAPSSSISTPSAMGPTYGELGYQGANAKSTADAIAAADAASKSAAGGMNTYQKLMAGSLALRALEGGGGSSGGGGTYAAGPSTTTTTSSPQMQYPQQQQLVMAPYMNMNTSGAMYSPTLYNYNTRHAAQGGMMYGNGGGISSLGSYSDGGRLLKGPGDGMSDNIPATIGQKQPAALADGEFVVPADVVSHLGNGSTDAGAKQLYKMMDKIRQARTGRKSQGKKINPNKFLPKD